MAMPESLRTAFQAWRRDSGLSDDDVLAELGRLINPEIVRATIQDEGPRTYFTDLTKQPCRGEALSASESAEVESLQDRFNRRDLAEAGQERLARLLDRVEASRVAKQAAARAPWGVL